MKNKAETLDRFLYGSALLLGALSIVWVGSIFVSTNALAFTITAVIGGVYAIGVVELLRFGQATSTLSRALNATQEKIDNFRTWLDRLDPSLRNAVRLRVEGQRVGLPAPVLTPYLVGLLVMLGLLGTFVGLVDTLRGAVAALEGTTELQAIRDGLAAPINGLGLAFGTSVAGVATSAMLGLMSTLTRRRRMLETRRLDTLIPIFFQDFSLVHSQRETFRALQLQTQSLPAVAGMLETVAGKLDQLGQALVDNQDRFHRSAAGHYTQLAAAMDQALKENLSANVRLVGETIKPVVKEAMCAIAQETQTVHGCLTQISQETLQAICQRLDLQSQDLAASWKEIMAGHQQTNDALITRMGAAVDALTRRTQETASRMQSEMTRLMESSADLMQSRSTVEEAWIDGHAARMDILTEALKDQLGALREDEDHRGQAAVARLEQLESVLASHLCTLGQALEAPLTRLIETTSEAPRAAASLIEQLRQETAKQVHRDNRLFDERRQIMQELDTLSASLNENLTGQREAIEQLVVASQGMMEDVGRRFADQVDKDVSNLSAVADTFAVSAVEMASLGESFSKAVDLFNASNGDLVDNLARIEEALDKTTARSDDQLGYFVAQAREIIDHSMLSQKEIFEELRQLRPKTVMEIEAD
jgi:ABC-type transporter Mla subunit MlaD